ncbi:MAG TPA: efflux RND transporter periplasmic adaptor subunit [Candidatus Angelobacter sp.]|nr:efflux RND transporter periplasmic adaptor subunit [Candidatus Angelobacter sp.]
MNRKILMAIVLVVAAAAAIGARSFFKRDNALAASGTLEARNVSVGSKIGGRVTQVLVAEGDHVQKDQLLVAFDDAELYAALLQARGRYAQAKVTLAKMSRGNRPEEVAQARAMGASRSHAVAEATAAAERARADAANAEIEYRRYRQLSQDGVVSREQLDAAENRYKMAQAQAASAEHAVTVAESDSAAATAAQKLSESGFRTEDVAAARADLERADGELKQAEARYLEREVRAPANAVVEVLDLRPGDLIPANSPVAKLLEADQLYVIVYVPQDQIGKVRIGQSADVKIDAFPNESFHAVVEQIRQEAEFLPRNVETKEEREHQVVGVKLRVENQARKLRAGIHADVRFREVN